jgi:periplasmic divalent cation tolerance protein
MISARIVLSTSGSKDEASKLANALVAGKLAACVNIVGPMRSVYRWKDKVEDGEEFLLVIKTLESQIASIERRIRELHTYELPEIVVLPIIGGSEAYLEWLGASVGTAS